MGKRWFLNTDEQVANFLAHVEGEKVRGRRITVEFVGEGRTTDQNAMLHAMLRQIAKQKDDETPEELKRYVQLHFGVPKLRETNKQFRSLYDKTMKGALDYEEKLEAMDMLEITSLLSKEQFSELIDQTQKHFAQQGYVVDP